MNQEAVSRLRECLEARGLEAALLSSPFTITWLTGYSAPIATGPSPFEAGPGLAWWRQGELTLIISDAEAPAAQQLGVSVQEYAGYTLDEPLRATERLTAVLADVLREHASLSGAIGAELDFLPAAALNAVAESVPQAGIHPIDADLLPLRAVKTGEEIEKIQRALGLCDVAQSYVREQARPGITELDLWAGLKGVMEKEVGEPLPVLADVVAGTRTAEVGGPPTSYMLQPGDPVILDVVPRFDGYWGDNANTYFVGEPASALRAAHRVVDDALQRGIEAIRPGVKASEVDALLRGLIQDAGYEPYPHHSGHGLGTSYHEEPRLVPNNHTQLAPGMVIAVEPGIYVPDLGGVRLEHAVLVTPDGCEVLTHHMARERTGG